MNRSTLALKITTGTAIALLLSPELPARASGNGSNFYGIDNTNNIYEVNPINKTNVLVNATGLGINQGSNGIAYDNTREHLFFFYNPTTTGTSATFNLQFWNRKSTGPASLKTINPVNSGPAPTNIPANAAYYNNSLWYLGGGPSSTSLNQLALTYNAQQDDITSWVLTQYNLSSFANPKYVAGTYGDIAIDTTNGLLYGSTTDGNYYSLNLNNLGSTSNAIYTDLGTINTLQGATPTQTASGLQLSFNADYTKLYGTRFCTLATQCTGYSLNSQPITPQAGDGLFFEIANFNTGDSSTIRNLTDADLLYLASPGFRDLGGATANALVPGPLPVLGLGAAFGWSRKLKRRVKPGNDH